MTAMVLLVGTLLSALASFVFAIPLLTPILGAAVIYPIFVLLVGRCQYNSAFGWVLFWALLQSIVVGLGTILAPARASEVFLNGSAYTEEMLNWIRTGEGAEGSLSLFLPIHLRQYAVFSFLSLVTFGSAALLLGTYLLNYMNFYVANLIKVSVNPWLAACLAWYTWSLLRVVGFIATGIALTTLGFHLVDKVRGKLPIDFFPKRYFLIGISFLLTDIIVKAILTPIWQKFLLIDSTSGLI
ncbi:MAG: hypothetical protein F6K10_38940 [Moorea sp. SIO2B7]|nr:hypothetical protein [Moorena sp. SIO2B7]